MTEFANKTVAIIGIGLIGGSIARGLRKANPRQNIVAVDFDEQTLRGAIDSGVINSAVTLEDAATQADIVVLATPPLLIEDLIAKLSLCAGPNTVFTDVGSAKSHICDAVKQQDSAFVSRFVPGHPIAGSERSGFDASRDDLFNGRNVILTPLDENAPEAVALVHELWRQLGADVLAMSVPRHDKVLAATSHLPHALAFALVEALLKQDQSDDIFRYAAGGFADFSRLASSDARMWSDVFVANAEATQSVLDDYIDQLQEFKALLRSRDREAMKSTFERAKRTRDNFIQKHFNSGSESSMETEHISLIVSPGGQIKGDIRVPGDKSISHRSVIFASLAEGVSHVSGFLEGEDALNTVAAFREMGVTIVGPENGEMTVYGVGMHGLKAPRKPLYMGNSGTAMRLLAGLLAAQNFDSELTGDESLNKRPMNRVADPLRQMGGKLETAEGGTPPINIRGAQLSAIDYAMPMASAQVKSCLLLAGMYADGTTSITEPAPCRDHTERMLEGFGYALQRNGAEVAITGGGSLQATDIDVPADISSAAFFMVAAAITPGSELLLRHVGINPTRTGVINILRAMGANITIANERSVGGEPVADIEIRYSQLKGIVIPEEQIPLAIDEFPVLFIAAACAEGETILRGAEELRVKESDRIEAMATGLRSLGVKVETYDDGIRIEGGEIGGGEVDSFTDHRIAMSFAVAGLRAKGEITVRDCANVATSFPGFVSLANEVGLAVREEKDEA